MSDERNTCIHLKLVIITRDREVIIFSPFVFLSVCLSMFVGLWRTGATQYFAGSFLGMSSCASYVSRTHDITDDIKRSQSGSNFEIDRSLSIFELERRSKAQNVGNANGYLSGIFNFRYHFWKKSLNWKYIPRTDDPTVKPAWLFQNTKRKWVVRFWSPGYISHHCAAN